MKTSKIIFISLLTIIAIFILAAFADVRINGHKDGTILSKLKTEKQSVPPFKVLFISNCGSVNVVQNDSSFIELFCENNSAFPKVNYYVKADTLVISDFNPAMTASGQGNNSNYSINISSTDLMKGLIIKKSDISIEHIRSENLSLDLDESKVWINQDTTDKTVLNSLNIVARNHSAFNSDEFSVDELEIILQNSEANLSINTEKLTGNLCDSSSISIWRQSGEISLKQDKTSAINLSSN